mmetsp:Transcript_80576/g.236794  ORF Transcript_80576/g.236794 Transcript_80576/m.236794 type:complete len:410 (-) Transcript_80576:14-1243(-)
MMPYVFRKWRVHRFSSPAPEDLTLPDLTTAEDFFCADPVLPLEADFTAELGSILRLPLSYPRTPSGSFFRRSHRLCVAFGIRWWKVRKMLLLHTSHSPSSQTMPSTPSSSSTVSFSMSLSNRANCILPNSKNLTSKNRFWNQLVQMSAAFALRELFFCLLGGQVCVGSALAAELASAPSASPASAQLPAAGGPSPSHMSANRTSRWTTAGCHWSSSVSTAKTFVPWRKGMSGSSSSVFLAIRRSSNDSISPSAHACAGVSEAHLSASLSAGALASSSSSSSPSAAARASAAASELSYTASRSAPLSSRTERRSATQDSRLPGRASAEACSGPVVVVTSCPASRKADARKLTKDASPALDASPPDAASAHARNNAQSRNEDWSDCKTFSRLRASSVKAGLRINIAIFKKL